MKPSPHNIIHHRQNVLEFELVVALAHVSRLTAYLQGHGSISFVTPVRLSKNNSVRNYGIDLGDKPTLNLADPF
jgi:hypothetical protein